MSRRMGKSGVGWVLIRAGIQNFSKKKVSVGIAIRDRRVEHSESGQLDR